MTPEEKDRAEQAMADVQRSDEISGAQENEQKWKRQRELDGHDRMIARGAAMAARDVLGDGGPGKEPGAYTVHEARDRAAHTPPIGTREPER